MKSKKISKNLCNILFVFYLIITFLMIFWHEPWADEAQSWSIARQLTIPEIWNYMKYEGHSCLWHLILKFFIELKFSYAILNFIPWVITSFTVIVFYFFASFKKSAKIIILYTPVSIYFSIFARPYALYFSLMILLIMVYQHRHQHPFIYGILLALIANTHVLTFGFIGSLILIDLYEIVSEGSNKKEKIISLIIAFIGILIFILQVLDAPSARQEFFGSFTNHLLFNLLHAFFSFFTYLGGTKITSFLLLLLFFTILVSLLKNKKMLFVALTSFLFQILFLGLFYFNMNDYHTTIYFMVLIFTLLMTNKNYHQPNITYYLLCFLTIISSIDLIYYEIKYDYSGCQNIIKYLQANINDGATIVHSYTDATILPYFDLNKVKMYSLTSDDYFYYDDFKVKSQEYTEESFTKKLDELGANYFIFYKRFNRSYDQYLKNLEESGKLKLVVDDSNNDKFVYKLYQYIK